MNLLKILRSRVDDLPDGDYMQGLKAVIQHIEVAGRHLERGQESTDDTAFTDAIYRTNQAFEGSLKEAYRVLAGKDPANESPFNIENYLQGQNILRSRVLAQLTNYRREWRNPSTHDYRLDFDEDEALLAIVNVSAFAIVMIDQITERISFDQAKAVAAEQPTIIDAPQHLLEKVAALIEQFTPQFNQTHTDRTDIREIEITAALAGFLATAAPEISTIIEGALSTDTRLRADLLLKSGDEQLIIEVKRGRLHSRFEVDAIFQVARYMELSGINQAILFSYASPNTGKVFRKEGELPTEHGSLIIMTTEEGAFNISPAPPH
jgi:hypothetical protein